MSGRVILQDLLNRSYLGSAGSWVASCQDARVFEHTYQALLEGLDHPEHTQVVWCFSNPSQNLYILVRPNDRLDVFPCETCPFADGANHACRAGPASRKAAI